MAEEFTFMPGDVVTPIMWQEHLGTIDRVEGGTAYILWRSDQREGKTTFKSSPVHRLRLAWRPRP